MYPEGTVEKSLKVIRRKHRCRISGATPQFRAYCTPACAAPMEETYRLLEADPADTTVVEKYLQEYFTQILQKLREVNAESRQGDFYL